jgi:hypothetical protein
VAGFSEYSNEPLGFIGDGISSSTDLLLTPQIDFAQWSWFIDLDKWLCRPQNILSNGYQQLFSQG